MSGETLPRLDWAQIGPPAHSLASDKRRSSSAGALLPKKGQNLRLHLDSQRSASEDSVLPPKPVTPDSPDTTQIFEFLKNNRKTEDYVENIVPAIVQHPRSLKDVPEFSRTLTRIPQGYPKEKHVLEELGHKNPVLQVEEQEPKPVKKSMSPADLLKNCAFKYLDEERCSEPCVRRRRRSSSNPLSPITNPLAALTQRIPIPRHLRHLTVKNLKMSLGLGLGLSKLCRRRTVVITESDPSYKVAYLGNVLTGWAKGEGCTEKPLSTLWKNYTASNRPDVNMKVAVTRSGLKAVTREHGLTEYWSHRITHCAAPKAFPRVFCWVYRHEGRKLKQELRCHAVLCAREEQAKRMADQLTERLALALLEFRRDKKCREQARLSLANALYDNPTLPQRKLLLSTGASNYRPPLERSKSAPKLGSIEESAEEEEGVVFGHPRAVSRFLREERLAFTRRQRFRESLRRRIVAEQPKETELEVGDLVGRDLRKDTLIVGRKNSIERQPDPPEELDERVERIGVSLLQRLQDEPPPPPSTTTATRRFLIDSESDGYRQDASESDEGSSSLQSISSDSSQPPGSHSRTDSGEDLFLGADALKTRLCTALESWCEQGSPARQLQALDDDFDDNVSDESGYVEATPEALLRRVVSKDTHQQCVEV